MYLKIIILLSGGVIGACQSVPSTNPNTATPPNPLIPRCLCPQGEIKLPNQYCTHSARDSALENMQSILAIRTSDDLLDEFYQSEKNRIEQGLLDQLTCGEQQQRSHWLTEVPSPNPTNSQLAITSIEELYRHHQPALESAYVRYAKKHRPPVIIIQEIDPHPRPWKHAHPRPHFPYYP